jgi:protein-disulfide isomerase
MGHARGTCGAYTASSRARSVQSASLARAEATGPVTGSSAVLPVQAHDHVTGATEPELTLIEYGDFGCRFCFAASRGVSSLLERYDSLSLVWRHLPDPELHPGADLAAELSELAATRGKFWKAHSLLLTGREQFFTNTSVNPAFTGSSHPS